MNNYNTEYATYKCRRCHHEITNEDLDIAVLRDMNNKEVYDLCVACKKDFEAFIKEKDTKRIRQNLHLL